MGYSKSSSKREVYSNTILPQEIRKTSNRQPNFTPKTTGKRIRKTTPKKAKTKLLEGRNHKDLRINKWKRNKIKNSKE